MNTNQVQSGKKTHCKHYTIAEARANFTDLASRVSYGGERMVIDRYHKPLMALVSLDDLALIEEIEMQQDIKLAKQRLRTTKKVGTTSLADLEKEIAAK